MKKKLLLFCLVMAFALCGAVAEGQLKIVASVFPLYDFATEIAGGNADVSMLIKPGMEEHDYEPTPADIVAIEESDVFFYVGGESDAWIEDILSSVDCSDKTVVKLFDVVDKLLEEDGEEDEYDEHIWTSPVNAMKIAAAEEAAMAEKDPANAESYAANLADYTEKLQELDASFREVVQSGKRNEILFGDRFPFLYFAQEYGLTWYAAFPGCSNETEPTVRIMAELIDKMREDQLPVVFMLEMGNERVAQSIADETGAKVLTLHSCHNVTKTQLEEGVSYLSLMQENVEALREALN